MGELINKVWLPQALTIGVGYELFWKLNPKKLKPFMVAFKQKKDEEIATINYTTWLQGRYNADAINCNFSKNGKYPDKPIDLSGKKETPKNKATRFSAWADAFNQQFKEEHPEGQ